MLSSWLILFMLFPVFLLLVYLATKASGRTIGIVLGAFILLTLSWGFLSPSRAPSSDWAYPIGTVLPAGTSVGETAISNKELWDRLTKSHIDLSEEKPAHKKEDNKKEDNEKDQVPKKDNPETLPGKPDWVENPPKRVGNLYRRVVSSEPYVTAEECHRQLEEQLQDVVRERVQTLVADRARRSFLVPDAASFSIGLGYLMREICQQEFAETITTSIGEMKRVHVLMEFNPTIESHLLAEWHKYERRHRLRMVGMFAAAALSLLAGIYGLLQFDTWTRGYYAKRLLVGVPMVIIVVVVLLLR